METFVFLGKNRLTVQVNTHLKTFEVFDSYEQDLLLKKKPKRDLTYKLNDGEVEIYRKKWVATVDLNLNIKYKDVKMDRVSTLFTFENAIVYADYQVVEIKTKTCEFKMGKKFQLDKNTLFFQNEEILTCKDGKITLFPEVLEKIHIYFGDLTNVFDPYCLISVNNLFIKINKLTFEMQVFNYLNEPVELQEPVFAIKSEYSLELYIMSEQKETFFYANMDGLKIYPNDKVKFLNKLGDSND